MNLHLDLSREVRLKHYPGGLPVARDFEIAATRLRPESSDGILVQNLYTRVSASIRMMVAEGATDVYGVPSPALKPGDVLTEETLGIVVSAPETAALSCGSLVVHGSGFREYSYLSRDEYRVVQDDLSDRAAHLSHGWTAYAALMNAACIHEGDTAFITGAGGAIGSMAGQIARLLGAGRIIGTAGTEEKARRLEKECGYDAVISRTCPDLHADLRSAAPRGVDAVLDIVGGEQLRAAIDLANVGARIVVLGALSGQLALTGTGRTAPVTLDSFPIILKRLRLMGYSADDDGPIRSEWDERFAGWLGDGVIRFPYTLFQGIERAPEAIEAITHGRTFGTVILGYEF